MYLIISWLVLAEIKSTVQVALPNWPINQFKKCRQSRQQILRAYCADVYTVAAAVNKGKSSTTNAKKCTSSSPPILHPSTQFASLSLTPISDILHYTSHQAIICMWRTNPLLQLFFLLCQRMKWQKISIYKCDVFAIWIYPLQYSSLSFDKS